MSYIYKFPGCQKLLSLSNKHLCGFQLLIITLSITSVYFLQYILNYQPCALCFYQRYPYFALWLISMVTVIFDKKIPKVLYKTLVILMVLLWLIEIALAGYHVGVEHGWFEYNSCKTAEIDGSVTLGQMKNLIEQAKPVDCSHPEFTVLGWSLAEMNLLFSLGMFAIIQLILVNKVKNEKVTRR